MSEIITDLRWIKPVTGGSEDNPAPVGSQPSLPSQAATLAIGIFQPPSLVPVHPCQDPVPTELMC